MRAHAKDVLLHNQNYLATQPLGCYRYSPCSCVLPLHPCNPSRNEGRYRRCSLKREAERCYRLLEPPSYRARLLVLCLLSRFLYGLAATARAASYLRRAAEGPTYGAVPVRPESLPLWARRYCQSRELPVPSCWGVDLRCGARSLRVCRFTSYPRARILWRIWPSTVLSNAPCLQQHNVYVHTHTSENIHI
jgi:hypothetical protein